MTRRALVRASTGRKLCAIIKKSAVAETGALYRRNAAAVNGSAALFPWRTHVFTFTCASYAASPLWAYVATGTAVDEISLQVDTIGIRLPPILTAVSVACRTSFLSTFTLAGYTANPCWALSATLAAVVYIG